MENRTIEFFTEKVKEIDEKIEECFVSLKNDTSVHLKEYAMKDSEMEVSSKYVGVAEMCFSIEKLEKLREFYCEKLKNIESPIAKLVRLKREKLEL